ncbi:MAG: hypothetical protein V5A23_03480 [Halobacteriales archaeon]
MIDCDCSVRTAGGAALVAAVVSSTAPTPRRVRAVPRVDAPVWPPRRNGVPEREWSDGELSVVVPAGSRLAIGFATPASPDSPPVELHDEGRADDAPTPATRPVVDAPVGGGPVSKRPPGGADGASAPNPPNGAADTLVPTPTPDGVVRALGDGRPPRDAVPESTPNGGSDQRRADPSSGARESDPPAGETASPPAPVVAWLDAVERRVATAEADSNDRSSANTAPPATEADQPIASTASPATEADRLRSFVARAGALADRWETAGTPADAE